MIDKHFRFVLQRNVRRVIQYASPCKTSSLQRSFGFHYDEMNLKLFHRMFVNRPQNDRVPYVYYSRNFTIQEIFTFTRVILLSFLS